MGNELSIVEPPQLDQLLEVDSWLVPYKNEIVRRFSVYSLALNRIEKELGGLDHFTKSYERYGCVVNDDKSITWTEWCPGVDSLALIGDFNSWQPGPEHYFQKAEYGKWSLNLPAKDGTCPIPHGSGLKIRVSSGGKTSDKASPWAKYMTCPKGSVVYQQQMYNPDKKYVKHVKAPPKPSSMRIYECHVGIASPDGKVATYVEFKDNVIPRIKKQGYNAIQLMAIMEHPYYASFGYQVTNFFAASSRYGTPCELKEMIDAAHETGLYVMLDIVHSHACKNINDGINEWNLTPGGYFHDNQRGFHDLWDSRLFNYTEIEVLRFLLSNLRWWLDEYGFDGFRFDGATSMLYHSHGMGGTPTNYAEYYGLDVDSDSVVYFMLVNHYLHTVYPNTVTIAEEVSGMPALCRPVTEGGLGFDYRLAMAIPDMWIKLLKHTTSDEDWDMENIVHTLENRRWNEKHIAYAESHDQALVGDKTIAFWLMDKEMYEFMSCFSPLTPVVERGLALHKMIRLVTHGLGGEGWLNFIGNEFGHPEWLDFPREGNKDSYHYARRQFNLPDDVLLRYKFLNNWDRAMNETEQKYGWLSARHGYTTRKNGGDKVIVFERAGLVFVFNFHPSRSFSDYRVGVEQGGSYRIILDSDGEEFGGHKRLDHSVEHLSRNEHHDGRSNFLQVYAPCRTCFILAPTDRC